MSLKTDRILNYLPGTFLTYPSNTVLYALVDAFGRELLKGENTLAEIMAAHWVDYADRGSEGILDLAQIAALYGLAPRREADLTGLPLPPGADPGPVLETVEEFRTRLKRYIRNLLDGTVTVQGILRMTAEKLSLNIGDTYEEMDCWWTRPHTPLVTVEDRRDDAALRVLGVKAITASGTPNRPALVRGTVDLSQGVDLRGANLLRLKVDNRRPIEMNLTAGVEHPEAVSLSAIAAQINQEMGGQAIATIEAGRFLSLRSATIGFASDLEVQDVLGDAVERILGLPPRVYRGNNPQSAHVVGMVALESFLDLSQERYLRLEVDQRWLAEIDCANPADPAQTTPQQVVAAINQGLGLENFASLQGDRLVLSSPSTGFGSSIAFLGPAAQNATHRLFGSVNRFYLGQDIQPARLKGRQDLSRPVDLSQRATLQLRLDGDTVITVNCAGIEPEGTLITEIVAAINEAAQANIATQDGRFITLTSRQVGARSQIALEYPDEGDASDLIFGISARQFAGADATPARIRGIPNLTRRVDLRAQDQLQLAVDGRSPVVINLATTAENLAGVRLRELIEAINAVLPDTAEEDDGHLVIASPTTGSASRLEIIPLQSHKETRFVTRAKILDEAAPAIFGFLEKTAQGTPATQARLVGQPALNRSVDLQDQRYLRLRIDRHPAIDIDCAGQRPRFTGLEEVVEAINRALRPLVGVDVASHDGQHLILLSPTMGGDSQIAIEPPRVGDGISTLLAIEPTTITGQDATSVVFTGTVDLREGVLLPPDAAIQIGIDGATPIEISLAGPAPNLKTLPQLLDAINGQLNQNLASTDGKYLILASPSSGAASQLHFGSPSGSDATPLIFGFIPDRHYQGLDARGGELVGQQDLSEGANLRFNRFLALQVGSGPVQVVDCAQGVASQELATVPLATIVRNLNNAIPGVAAETPDRRLILRTPTPGATARLTLEPFVATARDATPKLLGAVPPITRGEAAKPAVITGEVDLSSAANLSQRSVIRVAVDGKRPVDIDLSGSAPASVFLEETIAAINAVIPGLASATPDDRLQLTSPTVGSTSRLELLPLRYLELVEYPPVPLERPLERAVRHGDRWVCFNTGACDSTVTAHITAPQGVVSPTLINETLGMRLRLFTTLDARETVQLQTDPTVGLRATVINSRGETRPLAPDKLLIGPIGTQTWVPFQGSYLLSQDVNYDTSLQLNNPLAPAIVWLRARQLTADPPQILVTVTESPVEPVDPDALQANGQIVRLAGRLRVQEGDIQLRGTGDGLLAQLRPGPGVDLLAYQDRVVEVEGPLYNDELRILVVQQIDCLFEVQLTAQTEAGTAQRESYERVKIGTGIGLSDSLVHQITRRSRLVVAQERSKGDILSLPQGKSDWIYLDGYGSRFDQAHFNKAYFAGGLYTERGIFNVSCFGTQDRSVARLEPVASVFTASEQITDPTVTVRFDWVNYQPGHFQVNLPADLPARFGACFNEARFSQTPGQPERYAAVVTERTNTKAFDDAHFIVDVLEQSSLVSASIETFVPAGWQAIRMPFRQPQPLRLGSNTSKARIYLQDPEVNDQFIKIEALEAGEFGNDMTISVRPDGVAMYELTITYTANRFENARQVVQGTPLPALTQEILKPGSIGVLQAKAAGVQVVVTRDGCNAPA